MTYLIEGIKEVEVDNFHLPPFPVQLGTNKVKHLNQLRNAGMVYHEAICISTAPDDTM